MNPEINANCTNLIRGRSYCVEAVGSISTYANYSIGATTVNPCFRLPAPTSCFRPMAGLPTAPLIAGNVSFSRPTQTATSTYTPVPIPTFPTAPGTISGCYAYQNYFVVNETISGGPLTVNDCSYVAQSWEVLIPDLEMWNPSLSTTNCTFQPGYSYCGLQNENYTGKIINSATNSSTLLTFPL